MVNFYLDCALLVLLSTAKYYAMASERGKHLQTIIMLSYRPNEHIDRTLEMGNSDARENLNIIRTDTN